MPWLVLALAGCSPGEAPPATPATPARPPVILISLDTLRQDHLGLYGYPRDTTPFLDQLAGESIVFDRAYTTIAWTLAAHMSLVTGLYPDQHLVLSEDAALAQGVPTLAEVLQDSGYHTMGFYFPGFIDEHYGFGRGFDHFEPHQKAAEAQLHVSAAMADRPAEEPLFLFIHLFDIHNSSLARNDRPFYDPPPPYDRQFHSNPAEVLVGLNKREVWRRDSTVLSAEQRAAVTALYDGGIRYVDDVLRGWFETWSDEGWADDALVIITSDHGEGLLDHGTRYGGHGGTYEEGLRVPLLLRMPGGRMGGTRVPEPVSLVDVLPTVLDSLDLDLPTHISGRSLLRPLDPERMLHGNGLRGRSEFVLQWPWKFVLDETSGEQRLTNLESDPLERGPGDGAVDGALAPLLERARREQEGWFTADQATSALPPSREKRQRLEELGYGGDD